MKIILPTICLIIGVWLPSHALAEFNGNQLKEYCQFYPKHTESTAMCFGYIAGTLDMIRGVDKTFKLKTYCEPKDVTLDQFMAIVLKYIADHPEKLHLVAAGLLWDAYSQAFPCPKDSN